MLKTLKKSFEIDIVSAFNSFAYALTHNKLLKGIFKGNYYQKKGLKTFIRYLSLVLSFLRLVAFRIFYFGIIIYLLYLLKRTSCFKEVFLALTIVGMCLNTDTLKSGIKKYYNVILLGMDANKYSSAYILYSFIRDMLLNTLVMLTFNSILHLDIATILLISLIAVSLKVIGEYLNILYYKKYNKKVITSTFLVTTVLIIVGIILLLIVLLKVKIPFLCLLIGSIISLGLAILSFIKISKEDKLPFFFKQINSQSVIMAQESKNMTTREMAVEIRKKDYHIDPRKLKNKHGYNYFNTIFFERHKAILQRSALHFTFFIGVVIIGAIILILFSDNYAKEIGDGIIKFLPVLLIIMYFINRGSIITEAMFINCDHFMLSFNFYREPKVILNLFKERLKIVTKVNLLPALVLGGGLITILILSTNPLSILEYILLFVAVIAISVFFSVHYLVIYYLLQPYDVNLRMKSISYSIVSFLTYFVCYESTHYHFAPLNFSIMVIVATLLYIVISLIVVYKKAYLTFKLK
ncbi:MAG: hypothetical protein IJH18_00735 [Bacilli bacterium]|nr:hypothetical protein [Bacilli bacterium]